MKIKKRDANGVTVLDVSGEMYGGPENMRLVEVVKELAADRKLNLVINCSKVKWISSTGLGIMVTARNHYAKEGGTMRLCNLNERVLSLFQITKMSLILNVHDSESEALAAFQ
jgi:anti-sigma B factor antagonist